MGGNTANTSISLLNNGQIKRQNFKLDKSKSVHSKPLTPYDLHTYGLKLFKCSGKSPMASHEYSKTKFLSHDEKLGTYNILVTLYDERKIRRTTGGDVIVMWAEQVGGDGRISGIVLDNLNGSYTGKFKIFWAGKTAFRVKIASTAENQCLRSNALYKYGNTVYAKQKGWGIHAIFTLGNRQRMTKCGANPQIYLSPVLCNFTEMNAKIPWYCGSPSNNSVLKCSDIDRFTVGPFDTSTIPSDEKMTNFGHGVLGDKLVIDIAQKSVRNQSIKCSRFSRGSWNFIQPSGYWSGNRWNFINCDNSNMISSYNKYRTCLQGKHLAVIGDSTARDICQYLVHNALGLKNANLKDGLGDGPKRAYQIYQEYRAFNITMTFSKHEFPFHNINFPPYNITSMPLEVKKLESVSTPGKDLVVLLHYNQHLQAYPTKEFHRRIKGLIPAIKSLLIAKPGVKIIFKGPHMTIDDVRWFDPRISIIYIDILHKEFQGLEDRVIYLDTWSVTVALNSESPHPFGNAFISQIHQLMSYIC